MTRMAGVGERMVDLSERPDGTLMRSLGGDVLSTTPLSHPAWYCGGRRHEGCDRAFLDFWTIRPNQ
jgi:hypothetical protein